MKESLRQVQTDVGLSVLKQDLWALLLQHEWSPDLVPMIESLCAKLRQLILMLLTRAYSTVSVPTASALTGWSAAEATQGKILCEACSCWSI